MSVLASVKELAEEFKLPELSVESCLKGAKMRSHRVKVGTEEMSLYEGVRARTCIRKNFLRSAAPPTRGSAGPTSDNLLAEIKRLHDAASEKSTQKIAERLGVKLQEIVTQNNLGLQEARKAHQDAMDKLDIMTTNLFNCIAASAASGSGKPPELTGLASADPGRKPRIGVFGIFALHHANLEKEFSDVFDLKLLTPDESKKIKGLAGMDHIFVMVAHIGHSATELINLLKVPRSPMNSLLELRTALMNYALEQRKDLS